MTWIAVAGARKMRSARRSNAGGALIFALACSWCRTASAEPVSLAPPPRPLVLRAAPAPELPPREWERRPVELTASLSLGLPDCAHGSRTDERCAGLSVGGGLGLSALWRVSPYIAWGAGVNALGFGFSPPHSSGLSEASAGGVFVGLLGRVYLLERGSVEPYLELGLGAGSVHTNARQAGSPASRESARGGALRAGGGVELYLGDHLRLGPALSFTRFHVGQVQRCAADLCSELSADENGHGVGFVTFSLGLSVLLGEAL